MNITLFRWVLMSSLVALVACEQADEPQVTDTAELDAAIVAMEAAVADAALEVQRLRDVEEIENLMSAYSFYVDKSMHNEVTDLFSDDAVLEILGRGVFYGIDRIREYMHHFGAPGPSEGRLFNHMQIQHVVTVAPDGKTAKARARLFVMFGIADNSGQTGEATYENEFVKEDGVWKFQYLHGYQGHYTIYEDGWAKKASAMFSPYEDFPPDALQSVDYDPYPAAYLPPYHYPNPVTGK